MSSSAKTLLRAGICGLGTVGGGVLALLRSNAGEIRRRLGGSIEVSHVAGRTLDPAAVEGITSSSNPFAVLDDPAVDVVVETMGGFDPAFELIHQALTRGKHVVTANKALIAERGNSLFPVAEANGVCLAFESSVGGGIPIIKALREGLAANRIDWLAGIINGTGNFIMTEMGRGKGSFAEVLGQAQALGYAEADPALDVDGVDAAHKLTIMASLAFGIPLRFEATSTEGISQITSEDIAWADELGYRIKHLGIARRTEPGVELRVHPTLVPKAHLLANVDGVDNAILVHGNTVGSTLYRGPGAGGGPTASAVVADLMDVARQLTTAASGPPVPGLAWHDLQDGVPVIDIADIEVEYYLRIPALDQVGVMAAISSILGEYSISIEAVIQKEAVSETVPIVILTHRVREKTLNQAVQAIESLDAVVGAITRIRVESFHSLAA